MTETQEIQRDQQAQVANMDQFMVGWAMCLAGTILGVWGVVAWMQRRRR